MLSVNNTGVTAVTDWLQSEAGPGGQTLNQFADCELEAGRFCRECDTSACVCVLESPETLHLSVIVFVKRQQQEDCVIKNVIHGKTFDLIA